MRRNDAGRTGFGVPERETVLYGRDDVRYRGDQGGFDLRVFLRRGLADCIAHQNSEIESGHVREKALEYVVVFSQVRSSHASRFEVVRERSLE